MRKIKILVEIGGSDEPDEPAKPTSIPSTSWDPDGRLAAWELLKDARRKLANALGSGDSKQADDIRQWIGGGLATLSQLTGEDAPTLLKSLEQAVPVAAPVVPLPPRRSSAPDIKDGAEPYFRIDTNHVPPPKHPGAPKKLDLASLSEEEREKLGIILKDEIGETEDVSIVVADPDAAIE